MRPQRMARCAGLACLLVAFLSAACTLPEPKTEPASPALLNASAPTVPSAHETVSKGKEISFEYTLKVDNGKVLDSNVRSEPLRYVHGSSQLLPALEQEMEGMSVGESKKVVIPPSKGYGAVNPKQVKEVPKNLVPEDARTAGTQLHGKGPKGEPMFMRVVQVKDETVVLDFNHPLAGKTLYFDVKVVKIQDAPAQKPQQAPAPPAPGQ